MLQTMGQIFGLTLTKEMKLPSPRRNNQPQPNNITAQHNIQNR
jgi:hypothetical protein